MILTHSDLYVGVLLCFAITMKVNIKRTFINVTNLMGNTNERIGLTLTPGYTRDGIRCLKGVNISCQSVTLAVSPISENFYSQKYHKHNGFDKLSCYKNLKGTRISYCHNAHQCHLKRPIFIPMIFFHHSQDWLKPGDLGWKHLRLENGNRIGKYKKD
jgi:hypothetical protein